jgi:Domain of unknown function (DUF1840)
LTKEENMLYTFKSKETADLIMLAGDARHLLLVMGKDGSSPGILLPAHMAAALAALEQAVVEDDARRALALAEARERGEAVPETVSLRQRAAPMQALLRRCLAADVELVWGV